MIEPRIHQHTEEVEYLKELARQVAVQALESADIRDMVNSPQAFTEALLAAIVATIGPHVRDMAEEAAAYAVDLGQPDLTDDELDQITDETQSKFLGFAYPALLTAVTGVAARISDMIAAGVSFPAIHSALTSGVARAALVAPVIAIARRLASNWVQSVDRDVNDAAMTRLAQLIAGEEVQPVALVWVAVMDRNTCGESDDALEHYCRPRHGQGKTLAEWGSLGMPGSPVLECSMHSPRGSSPCRCILSANPLAASIAAPIVASAAVKRGQARARADMAAKA